MQQALELANNGLGRTAPNPPVGCVIVQNNEIVGRGFHLKAGEPHAEVFALREAGDRARDATAFVTLEPCSHFGRTPPCTDALIASGVRRVVIAALDPNPQVAGRGIEKLRAAQLEVTCGVLHDHALQQQAGFRSLVTLGRPWVVYKFAMTLDGKTATRTGHSQWVSGEQSRALVHQWRNEFDAIAVGSGTVLADNPSLTTRGIEFGRDPRRVVFDRSGRVPHNARALGKDSILVTSEQNDTSPDQTRDMTVLRATGIADALQSLGKLGISSVMLEGGASLAGAFLEHHCIDEIRAFVAPKLLGAGISPLANPVFARMDQARNTSSPTVEKVGGDILIRSFLHNIPSLPFSVLETIRP